MTRNERRGQCGVMKEVPPTERDADGETAEMKRRRLSPGTFSKSRPKRLCFGPSEDKKIGATCLRQPNVYSIRYT